MKERVDERKAKKLLRITTKANTRAWHYKSPNFRGEKIKFSESERASIAIQVKLLTVYQASRYSERYMEIKI
jgi:hypothetical protein